MLCRSAPGSTRGPGALTAGVVAASEPWGVVATPVAPEQGEDECPDDASTEQEEELDAVGGSHVDGGIAS